MCHTCYHTMNMSYNKYTHDHAIICACRRPPTRPLFAFGSRWRRVWRGVVWCALLLNSQALSHLIVHSRQSILCHVMLTRPSHTVQSRPSPSISVLLPCPGLSLVDLGGFGSRCRLGRLVMPLSSSSPRPGLSLSRPWWFRFQMPPWKTG